jgi:hypothetical protein
MSGVLAMALLLVRAEEAWQPVLLGGMIPVVGALAIFGLIYKAVKDNPENDPPAEDEASPPEEERERTERHDDAAGGA